MLAQRARTSLLVTIRGRGQLGSWGWWLDGQPSRHLGREASDDLGRKMTPDDLVGDSAQH